MLVLRIPSPRACTFGRVDVLVNNAAIFAAIEAEKGPFESICQESWDRMFAVNVRGTWLCCREVVPQMRKQRSGSIVNISSGTAWGGTPGFLHYVTSKAAVAGFTRALARELGPDGIRVNTIAPGATESDTALARSGALVETQRQRVVSGRIIQRPEKPEDLVPTLIFLASDDSGFITGQTMHVDGGSVLT